jgi:hypothetical protein
MVSIVLGLGMLSRDAFKLAVVLSQSLYGFVDGLNLFFFFFFFFNYIIKNLAFLF